MANLGRYPFHSRWLSKFSVPSFCLSDCHCSPQGVPDREVCLQQAPRRTAPPRTRTVSLHSASDLLVVPPHLGGFCVPCGKHRHASAPVRPDGHPVSEAGGARADPAVRRRVPGVSESHRAFPSKTPTRLTRNPRHRTRTVSREVVQQAEPGSDLNDRGGREINRILVGLGWSFAT